MGDCIASYLEKIINDKDISRQGREMLILLKSLDIDGKNSIRITLKDLLYKLDTQNKHRVCNTLKELEDKGYIFIDKGVGKANKYTFLKEHLVGVGEEVGTSYKGIIVGGSKSDIKSGEEYLPRYENSSKEILPGNEDSREEILPGYKSRGEEYLPPNEVTSKENLPTLRDGRIENLPALVKSGEEILPTLGESSVEILPPFNINNNNYINNNINDVFINIFNHWNKQCVSSISDLDLRVKDSINIALSKYSFESIIKAISNYSEVYHSDYFYNIKWNLNSFLTNPKAIDKFQDNGQMWMQYRESKFSDNGGLGEEILDKYVYIDA